MKDLTFLVITFLRDEYLFDCIKSLRETYGYDCKIVVGENGYKTEEKRKFLREYKANYYKLPFDSGVGQGRNLLVKKIKTKYLCVGDDDFRYDEEAKVDKMLDIIKGNEQFDLVGGRIREGGKVRNYQGDIKIGENNFIYTRIDDKEITNVYKYNLKGRGQKTIKCDITFNFFVARTEMCRDLKWDKEIKVRYEHSDWFISLEKAGKNIQFYPNAIVIHKPLDIVVGNKREYWQYRNRREDDSYFIEKHNVDWIIDFTGRKTICNTEDKKEPDMDFIITTFLRKESLKRLLLSIMKFYPFAKISIADQGRKFIVKEYKELWSELYDKGLMVKPTAYNLEFDSGLSKSRNFLVKNTSSKYVLLLDDDFVFTENTDVSKFRKVLESDKEIGVVGGLVLEEDGQEIHYEHKWEKKGTDLWHIRDGNKWKRARGVKYKETESVLNFALFRRELFQDIDWDNEIKISGEHTDFLLRLKDTKWKVAYTPDVSIKTVRSDNSREYKELRHRDEYLKKVFKKHNLKRIIYLNKRVYDIQEDKIIKYRTNENR